MQMAQKFQPTSGIVRLLRSVVRIDGTEVRAAIVSDLGDEEENKVFRKIVRYVESGFRDGPGYRDTRDGGRIALWYR